MSTYESSYCNLAPTNGQELRCPLDLAELCPAIFKVLNGVRSEDGKTCVVPHASIIVFAESGTLKFCISPKTGNKVAFGTISDVQHVWESLEQAIEHGKFEWKHGKR